MYILGEIKGQLLNSETKYIVTTALLLPKVNTESKVYNFWIFLLQVKAATEGSNIQIIVIGGQAGSSYVAFEDLIKDQGGLINRYIRQYNMNNKILPPKPCNPPRVSASATI